MAKIENVRQDNTVPQIGGRFVMRTWKGKLIAQKWPKASGKRRSKRQLEQQERFEHANLLAKYAPEAMQETAMAMGSKGPLYPRDYLVSAMFGGLYILHLPDGRRLYPMSLVQDITRDFDIIAQKPGMMLARGLQVWEPVAATADGQVLYWPSKDQVPVPVSPGPEIGGRSMSSFPLNAINSVARATKGNMGTFLRSVKVLSIWPSYIRVSGGTFIGSILRMSGLTVAEIVGQTAPWVPGASGSIREERNLISPVTLAAGTRYAIVVTRTDGSPTTALGMWASSSMGFSGIPTADDLAFVEIISNGPNVNDVVASTSATAFYTCDFLFQM